MQLKDLHSKPGHLIRRAQQIAVAIFMEECAGFDLTPVQYAVLVAIRENPGIDATRLSALIAFDRSTLGVVLERLEVRRLVKRYSSPGRQADQAIEGLRRRQRTGQARGGRSGSRTRAKSWRRCG